MNKTDYIHIGHCTTPHGIKGEFSFVIYNQEDSILKSGIKLTLIPRSELSTVKIDGEIFTIKKINFGNKTIVSLDGVIDRNIVEKMIPFDIYVDRNIFPDLEFNEFYINDLLGCLVINHITKEEVGRVIDFYENGQQLILKIQSKIENLEVLFINHFVPVVDIENQKIEIILPVLID